MGLARLRNCPEYPNIIPRLDAGTPAVCCAAQDYGSAIESTNSGARDRRGAPRQRCPGLKIAQKPPGNAFAGAFSSQPCSGENRVNRPGLWDRPGDKGVSAVG